MKENSRYFVINPDHQGSEDLASGAKSKVLKQDEVEYTDGFYSSSTENENEEIKMIQAEFQTGPKVVGSTNLMIDEKSDISFGIELGQGQDQGYFNSMNYADISKSDETSIP